MRPAQLLAAVVAISSVTAAWPEVLGGTNALARANNVLYGRQDNNQDESMSAEPTKTDAPKSTAKNEDEEKASSTSNAKETGSAKESDKPSGTEKETGDGKASSTKSEKPAKSSNKVYDPRLPAGGVALITPGPFAGQQLYKVGEFVTFVWNYTSLSVSPTALNILATCTKNQATYTLAVNQTVKQTGSVVWDTGKYQEEALKGKGGVPFLTEKYQLIIYDAAMEHPESATPEAAHLAVFNQLSFGMYVPKPAVAWKDFECANCNPSAGLSAFENLTLKAMVITTGTTLASLLYFASSFGVL